MEKWYIIFKIQQKDRKHIFNRNAGSKKAVERGLESAQNIMTTNLQSHTGCPGARSAGHSCWPPQLPPLASPPLKAAPHTHSGTPDKLPTPCHTVPTCEEANVQPLGQAHTAQGCWPALQKPEAHCCHSGASAGQGPAATGDSLTSFLCPDDRE